MQGVGIIGWIVIGIAAGFVAEKVMKRDHGLLTNLLVGVVGALLGGWIASLLNIGFGGWIGSFVVATIGAIILLFLLGMIKRR
ncbi:MULTISPECIES: GlsB/YeaQ/YmgE family stress response membrane protein [Phenylobacterium]|uniref:Membrane protein YeaQ/YmgE (Transglycosylase-associated protein family) n=1 Tax=Phenylobacterium koreense TaxID=266125 RepID=A0ABV2ELF3_9CAUL